MQVRTFTGASSQEILARIKAEMGPEAVIIGNRTFKKNGEICHEITAGIDRNPVSAQQPVGTMPGDGMPSGWSDWHKDWLQIKEQIFALMKPAIIGAQNATTHIRDGLDIAVDCAHGNVQSLQAQG